MKQIISPITMIAGHDFDSKPFLHVFDGRQAIAPKILQELRKTSFSEAVSAEPIYWKTRDNKAKQELHLSLYRYACQSCEL